MRDQSTCLDVSSERRDLTLFRFARDPRWSETGDRYIVKLFRDYVFHQVDEAGNPVVNISHVLTCLNKVRCLCISARIDLWIASVSSMLGQMNV